MKKSLLTAFLMAAANSATAAIPLVNASCPGGIEVHADKGGPIYINGKEGKLKKFSDSYYEAKHESVTISLTINPDGTIEVSYAGKNRAHGVCEVKKT